MLATAAPEIRIGEDTFDTRREGVTLDQLGRREQGARLSDLVDRIDGPFVIALDGAWGTGKSHFLQLCCGSHGKLFGKKGRVIHFDAFAHDWQDDPLLGLTRAIAAEISFDDPTVVEMGKNALRVSARVLTATTFGVAKGLLGTDILGEAMKAGAEALGQISDKALTELWQAEKGRENAIRQFSADLKALAEAHGKLILVIDELDRCRPDFALALLEIAKHAFAVPGVIFVLGVNLEAMGHSVRKRYGAGVDAEVYLQKFVNMATELPPMASPSERAWINIYENEARKLGIENTKRVATGKELLECVKEQSSIAPRASIRTVHALALLSDQIETDTDAVLIVATSATVVRALFPDDFRKLATNVATRKDFLTKFDMKKNDIQLAAIWRIFFREGSYDETYHRHFGHRRRDHPWQQVLHEMIPLSFFEPNARPL